MAAAHRPPRVVIDTNLVLSALVFGGGRPGALRRAWQQRRVIPLISTTTTTELLRTLGYPKFRLTAAEQQELLADYLPWCETVTVPDPPPATPACRDPFDQPFLHLAAAGSAHFLVTGDADLLILADAFAPRIITAARLLESLEREA